MYDRVLIPTDGSENVTEAIENGIEIADRFEATVHALSVVPPSVSRDRLRYDPATVAEEAIEDVEAQCHEADVDVVTEIRKGEPGEEILSYCEEHDIDVIVMGTHGRTGLDHILFGSIAERIVQNTSIPAMTVPPKRLQRSSA